MRKNVIVKESKIHGKGVFTATNFRESESILDVDDSHVVTDTSILTKENYDFDLDFLADGKIIWMQPPEKYINHSCDPNVWFKTTNNVRKIYAMRDIPKGEELVCDYSINGWGDAAFECNCGSENCRRIWRVDFFKLPLSVQRKYLPYLEDWFKKQVKGKIEELNEVR